MVCARYLHDAGARVALYIWKRAENPDDQNWKLCRERNIPTTRAEDDANFVALKNFLADTDIIIDALLGTGVARPVDGLLKELLVLVKAQSPNHPITQLVPSPLASRPPRIIAVDLPSGLNPDTGALDPAALDADLTVTFAFPKIGQLTFPGANAIGELVIADIGISPEWADCDALDVATTREIAALLPARSRDSHKGTFGKAMICAGSMNYVGAAFLAGSAATRAGTGLVTLALARSIYPLIASALHEATFVVLPDENGALVPDSVRVLIDHLPGYDALLIGCGFGRKSETVVFVQSLLAQVSHQPSAISHLVIDADALFALAQSGDLWTRLTPNRAILTPHPGEMAMLTSLTR
ncbi:MAG: bifunctional ADP-dependent NAD(P)H-hydrate dehydratase/NAD(P)H-hydrate epimerase, partial [Anaerolineales bacterium]|nr:bifunctional ADP-dependent NAD(P)H-hydrate dehydratase/NAD(P)H-hydrate epimerase [Anaerolineales bacterium]